MKKTTSFHLEKDLLDEIEEYKVKYDLSSRNAALERMLLERNNLLFLKSLVVANNFIVSPGVTQQTITPIQTKVENDLVTNSIDNAFDEMPD